MLPALFAVLGDFVTGGARRGMRSRPSLVKSRRLGQLAAGNEVRALFPHANLPWYQSGIGEGLLNYGISVDRGYFGGHYCSGRVGGCVRLRADRTIWQVGKNRCRAADRAGAAAGPARAGDPGRAQLANRVASAGARGPCGTANAYLYAFQR